MFKNAFVKVSFSPCRFCAHNSKKKLIKRAGQDYFRTNIEPHSNHKVKQTAACSFHPTSASFDWQLEDDLQCELPRVLYYERETHPIKLPPEFVSHFPIGQSKVLKMLEWQDMMKRRRHVDIPEFYAGSILRVVYADQYATNGKLWQQRRRRKFMCLVLGGWPMNGVKCLISLLNHANWWGFFRI